LSRLRELEQHLRQLAEIGEIMRSMKILAVMETRKLTRFLDALEQSVRCIEAVADDLLDFHPHLAGELDQATTAILVIGSERGFCGDFNEQLVAELAAVRAELGECQILGVGRKLCDHLTTEPGTVGEFAGPSVAEEVADTLNHLVSKISVLEKNHARLHLIVLHHRNGVSGIHRKRLLPPFTRRGIGHTRFTWPPLLYLAPERFVAELMEHYLFAALHEIFYTSLMAENQRRIQHLEGAVRRLDEKNGTLARAYRKLRQEEITEEIELILLSAEGVDLQRPI
jgi:F-type H+-transporting ATPase subunit gamma